jgi:hypothetical protein
MPREYRVVYVVTSNDIAEGKEWCRDEAAVSSGERQGGRVKPGYGSSSGRGCI